MLSALESVPPFPPTSMVSKEKPIGILTLSPTGKMSFHSGCFEDYFFVFSFDYGVIVVGFLWFFLFGVHSTS